MKFKKLFLLLFPLMISLLPSCSEDIDQAIIERKENIKTTVEIKDAKELNKMIANEQSFILFTVNESCLCTINSRKILNKIIERNEIIIYEVRDTIFYDSALSKELVIALPELTIFNKGLKNYNSIHLNDKFEKEINNANKEESVQKFLNHIEKYAFLNSPFFKVTHEELKSKIENKEQFNVYFKRNSCSDCKMFNKLFLDKWTKTNEIPYVIYELDLDLFRDDEQLYQSIKDYYKLSSSENNPFGYLTGVVPTIQSYVNGELFKMNVIYNDQFEQLEDGRLKVVDGYNDQFNNNVYDSYEQYLENTTQYYSEKFLETIKK